MDRAVWDAHAQAWLRKHWPYIFTGLQVAGLCAAIGLLYWIVMAHWLAFFAWHRVFVWAGSVGVFVAGMAFGWWFSKDIGPDA